MPSTEKKMSPGGHLSSAKNRDKHQIEVMVLSKVDPIDSAFPGQHMNISETNLSASQSQVNAGARTALLGPQQLAYQHAIQSAMNNQGMNMPSKKNPFKGGLLTSNLEKTNSAQIRKPPMQNRSAQPSGPMTQPSNMRVSSQQSQPAQNSAQPDLGQVKKITDKLKKDAPEPTDRTSQPLVDESKYGKDFKIPELPPLLQEQLFGDANQPGADIMSNQLSLLSNNPATTMLSPGSHSVGQMGRTQYKIKKFIDEIYQKEMKHRSHRQYVREDFLLTQSPIFNLGKSHNLRTKVNFRKPGVDNEVVNSATGEMGNKPLSAESLTNVLGFQAGGPHVVAPMQMMHNKQPIYLGASNSSRDAMPTPAEFELLNAHRPDSKPEGEVDLTGAPIQPRSSTKVLSP